MSGRVGAEWKCGVDENTGLIKDGGRYYRSASVS